MKREKEGQRRMWKRTRKKAYYSFRTGPVSEKGWDERD